MCWCASGAVQGALSDVRAGADASFPGFALLEVGCASFGCHLLSPDVTSGVRAAAGLLMVEPMGAICS
jgi:hypothetical protein